jgi:putative nucleotidyltransferase with HDIG domain
MHLKAKQVSAFCSLETGFQMTTIRRQAVIYIVPIILGGFMILAARLPAWQAASLLLPALYVVYRFHIFYRNHMNEEKKTAEQFPSPAKEEGPLNRRMIDLLALAIEAKDQTTHEHLERVEVYAVAVGQELGLDHDELEALRASALLHDIGKLAVPEYIISKPGKLTPAEFEKMKAHTVVGAEIVESIHLPYEVAPIVRSHHERWDGAGYPDGLAGEQIPIGARVLSAVDCLDALASDRQYRRALPLDQAIKIVEAEAGKAFDPKVVAILVRRYVELEHLATCGQSHEKARLSRSLKIMRGGAPAAGFEPASGLDPASASLVNFHYSLAETQAQPGLSALLVSVRERVPCDVMALYRRCGDMLLLERVEGEEYRSFASREIPLGTGLSGWVAENARSIVNGNPSVEPGYLNNAAKFGELRSALAIPLEARGSVVGVLSLYRRDYETFTLEDLSKLLSFSSIAGCALDSSARAKAQHA